MRRYETIVILQPTLGEDDFQAVIDRTVGIIEDFNGSMIKINRWGLKTLAYLIKKNNQGYYIYMQYAGVPSAVNEMERVYRIDDRVMKFLTVKLQDVFTPLPEDEETDEPEPETSSAEPVAEEPAEKEVVKEKPAPTEEADPEEDPASEETSEKESE